MNIKAAREKVRLAAITSLPVFPSPSMFSMDTETKVCVYAM